MENIYEDERSKESIKLIAQFLVKSHKDKDENSLFCRFNELIFKGEELQISFRAVWNSYIKALEK